MTRPSTDADRTDAGDSEDPVGRALSSAFARRADSDDLPQLLLEAPKQDAEPVPEQLGKYEVRGVLGKGGFGVVYRVYDPRLERELAMKTLTDAPSRDSAIIEHFLHEARICSGLRHPGIVPIYDIDRLSDGRLYFTMDIVDGKTLDEILMDQEAAGTEDHRNIELFEKICQTVAYAHSNGVVHGDIKPSNAMVGAFGEVKVVDWGFAHEAPAAAAREASDSSLVAGTPSYMSPEQARGGTCDAKADVFALGGTLCEILTGQPPYVASTRAEVYLHATNAWQDALHTRLDHSGADSSLVALARRCLAPNPADRPADAGEVAEEVAAHLSRLEARARVLEIESARAIARAAADRRSRRLAIALAVITVVGTISYGLWEMDARQKAAADLEFVTQTVERARNLADSAKNAEQLDTSSWHEARLTLERAVAFADERGVHGNVKLRAERLLEEVRTGEAQAIADASMHQWMEEVAPHLGDSMDRERIDAAHVARFADYGLDLTLAPEGDLAQQIRSCAIAEAVVRRLDRWAGLRRQHLPERDWRRLHRIADLADSSATRTQIRRAWAEDDVDTLRALCADPASLGSPTTVDLLAFYMLRHDRREAIRVRYAAVEKYPSNFAITHDLCQAMRGLESVPHDEIIRFASMGIAVRPDSAHAHADLAYSLIAARRVDEIPKTLAFLRERFPDYPRTWEMVGMAARQNGAFEDAAAAYRRSLELRPEDPRTNAIYGMVLENLGDLPGAIRQLRRAIELGDFAATTLGSLATALMRIGQYEEAERLLRQACDLDPELAVVRGNLGVILSRCGRTLEAMEWFERAGQLAPNDPQYPTKLAAAVESAERETELAAEYADLVAGRLPVYAVTDPRNLARMARDDDEFVLAWRLFQLLEATPLGLDRYLAARTTSLAAESTTDPYERELALEDAVHWLRQQLELECQIDPASEAERWALRLTLEEWKLHVDFEPLRSAAEEFSPAEELFAAVDAKLRTLTRE